MAGVDRRRRKPAIGERSHERKKFFLPASGSVEKDHGRPAIVRAHGLEKHAGHALAGLRREAELLGAIGSSVDPRLRLRLQAAHAAARSSGGTQHESVQRRAACARLMTDSAPTPPEREPFSSRIPNPQSLIPIPSPCFLFRFSVKNSCISPRHSSAIKPATTVTRWFQLGSSIRFMRRTARRRFSARVLHISTCRCARAPWRRRTSHRARQSRTALRP